MQLPQRGNLDAATSMRSANNEVQNAIKLHTQAPQIVAICSSKTGSRRQSGKTTILKRFFKRNFKWKMNSAKIEKILLPKQHLQFSRRHWQCDLQLSAEKCNSISHAAATTREPWRSYLNAICKQWGAKRNKTTHTGSTNCSDLQLQNRISTSKTTNLDFEALFKKEFWKENKKCQNRKI